MRFLDLTAADDARIAIHDDVEAVSFAEIGRRAASVAGALRARGLSGKRVAMLVTQGSGWVEAFFGGVLADATLVPLSHLHPEAEQRWFVETSGARAIVVSEELAPRVAPYAGDRAVLLYRGAPRPRRARRAGGQRGRRHRAHPVHQRHHRQAEGRAHHAREPGGDGSHARFGVEVVARKTRCCIVCRSTTCTGSG